MNNKFKNTKEFFQSLKKFDETAPNIDGYNIRTSLTERFYELGEEISKLHRYSYWKSIWIPALCLISVGIAIVNVNIANDAIFTTLICAFAIVGVWGYTIDGSAKQEAYIRRKIFAQNLLAQTINHNTAYETQLEACQKAKRKAIDCKTPLEYLEGNDCIPYMTEEQIQKYWKEVQLPLKIASCEKNINYYQIMIEYIEKEQELLHSILYSD
jgi:hypothetical protein